MQEEDIDIGEIKYGPSQGSIHSLKSNLKLQDLSELLEDEKSLSVAEMKFLSTFEAHLEVEFAATIEEFY